jgi:hypothetical protein
VTGDDYVFYFEVLEGDCEDSVGGIIMWRVGAISSAVLFLETMRDNLLGDIPDAEDITW